jgi:hypothetical protein
MFIYSPQHIIPSTTNVPHQACAVHLQSITQLHMLSMVAMHLPWLGISAWTNALCEVGFRNIKAPIIIGTKRPIGYSPTWLHKPLSSCQTFFMFKNTTNPKPSHNAWRMFQKNPKGGWREYWSDLVLLQGKEYHKTKEEIRQKVNTLDLCF